LDALSQLTIVIPTYGRPVYVRRQVEFWKDLPVQVVIADGGTDKSELGQVTGKASFTYLNSHESFYSRMLDVVSHINTEYVAVLGDDDFFSPDGLRRCIKRLDRDTSIVGCVGRSVRFFYQAGRILAEQRDPESSEFPTDVVTGLQRLHSMYHPGKIGALFYGVYRSEPWKEVVSATYSSRFATGYIYDTIIRTLLTYRGPIGIEESLTWYCSSENPPIKSAPGMERRVDLLEWLTMPEFEVERISCRTLLAKNLSAIGNDDLREIEPAIDFVLAELRRRYELKAQIGLSMAARARRVVLRFAPLWMKRLGKRIMPRALGRQLDWNVREISQLVTQLRSGGIDVNDQDLEQISLLVRATHS